MLVQFSFLQSHPFCVSDMCAASGTCHVVRGVSALDFRIVEWRRENKRKMYPTYKWVSHKVQCSSLHGVSRASKHLWSALRNLFGGLIFGQSTRVALNANLSSPAMML